MAATTTVASVLTVMIQKSCFVRLSIAGSPFPQAGASTAIGSDRSCAPHTSAWVYPCVHETVRDNRVRKGCF
jgi:hypothetical protein